MAELKAIPASQVNKIVVDSNPTAEYSASNKGVVYITTKTALGNTLSTELSNTSIFARNYVDMANVSINEKYKKREQYSYGRVFVFKYNTDRQNHRDCILATKSHRERKGETYDRKRSYVRMVLFDELGNQPTTVVRLSIYGQHRQHAYKRTYLADDEWNRNDVQSEEARSRLSA